jgi:hypothetical protein
MTARSEGSREATSKPPFREFVPRLKTSNPLVQAFIDYTTENPLPRLSSWADVKTHLNRVRADQGAFSKRAAKHKDGGATMERGRHRRPA